MNWKEGIKQFEEPLCSFLTGSHCFISTDEMSALLCVESADAAVFLGQLYYAVPIYSYIKKNVPSIKHLSIVSGSVYELLTTSKASFISLS